MANEEVMKFIRNKKAEYSIDEEQHRKEEIELALRYHSDICEMLENPSYEYARDFLMSVLSQLEEHESITPKQIAAIERVKDKPSYLWSQ